MTPSRWNHIESAAQIVSGSGIAFTGYLWFGISFKDAIRIDIVLTAIIYAKTYYVRVLFDHLRGRQ
jgi:hypothetical protein